MTRETWRLVALWMLAAVTQVLKAVLEENSGICCDGGCKWKQSRWLHSSSFGNVVKATVTTRQARGLSTEGVIPAEPFAQCIASNICIPGTLMDGLLWSLELFKYVVISAVQMGGCCHLLLPGVTCPLWGPFPPSLLWPHSVAWPCGWGGHSVLLGVATWDLMPFDLESAPVQSSLWAAFLLDPGTHSSRAWKPLGAALFSSSLCWEKLVGLVPRPGSS